MIGRPDRGQSDQPGGSRFKARAGAAALVTQVVEELLGTEPIASITGLGGQTPITLTVTSNPNSRVGGRKSVGSILTTARSSPALYVMERDGGRIIPDGFHRGLVQWGDHWVPEGRMPLDKLGSGSWSG